MIVAVIAALVSKYKTNENTQNDMRKDDYSSYRKCNTKCISTGDGTEMDLIWGNSNNSIRIKYIFILLSLLSQSRDYFSHQLKCVFDL